MKPRRSQASNSHKKRMKMAKATKHEEFLNDIAQANKVFAEHHFG